MDEEKEVHAKLAKLFESGSPQLWAGDFNALTREDYTREQWEEVARVREQNSWESPRIELTSKVYPDRTFKLTSVTNL